MENHANKGEDFLGIHGKGVYGGFSSGPQYPVAPEESAFQCG
jgi:hypothetical protein